MVLSRRISAALLGVAGFLVLSWANFARNLWTSDTDHPRGYYVAHGALILVNLAIAGWLAHLGWRGFKHYDEERIRQYYDDREFEAANRRPRFWDRLTRRTPATE
jgi:hypothetical protein